MYQKIKGEDCSNSIQEKKSDMQQNGHFVAIWMNQEVRRGMGLETLQTFSVLLGLSTLIGLLDDLYRKTPTLDPQVFFVG